MSNLESLVAPHLTAQHCRTPHPRIVRCIRGANASWKIKIGILGIRYDGNSNKNDQSWKWIGSATKGLQ